MKLVDHIVKKFDPKNPNERQDIHMYSGMVGIVCNTLLCIIKWSVGVITHSISIQVDAINNLTDATSNIITILGAKLAKKPIDKEHPFGHGRMEYVTSFLISTTILVIGLEFAQQSFVKMIHPQALVLQIIPLILLCLSILVKIWMAIFNHQLYQHTKSLNLKVVVQDSINDCLCSTATIISLLICTYTTWYSLDGIVGLMVSFMILKSAIEMIIDILNPLLGQAPSEELVSSIKTILQQETVILGIHELMVHDYGPGRTIASVHVEVSSEHNLVEIHDVIDRCERRILKELHVILTIHMDPIELHNKTYQMYARAMEEILHQMNTTYRFHDLQLQSNSHITFDITIPYQDNTSFDQIKQQLQSKLEERFPGLVCDINVEHPYL